MELDADAARASVQTIADAMGLGSAEEAAEGILAIVNENMAGRAPARLGAAGPRSAGVRPRRLRRRGAAPRERGGRDHGVVPRPRAAGPGSPVRDRRPRSRLPRRVRPDVHPRARRGRAGRGRLDPRGARRACDGVARQRGHPRGRALGHVHGGHALPPTGLRDPGRDRPRRGEGRPRGARGALQRASTSSSTGSACRAPPARSSTCGRSAPAQSRSPSCPSARRATPTRRAPSSEEHEIVFKGERLPTKIYDRAKLTTGNRFDGPAIVTEFDSTTVVLPGYAAEIDANLNILINPKA